MDKKIIIYESAMCCPGGACCPNPDQALLDLQDTLEQIKNLGAEFERYSITQSPRKFRDNPEVIRLIQRRQLKALPITTFNGKVVKSGNYPTLEELKKLLKDGVAPGLVLAAETTSEQGCCAGQDFCDIRCAHGYRDGARSDAGGNCC